MDDFGINSSEDLPKIREVFAEQLVQPTLINDNDFKTAEAGEEASLPANESRGIEENVHRS
jgi:segregation and condensation protein B